MVSQILGLMLRTARWLLGLLPAALVMGTLGVMAQSTFVLRDLSAVGANIGFGEYVSMYIDDVTGLGLVYAIVNAIGFLIAFGVAAGVHRLTGLSRGFVFGIAGGVSVAVALIAIQELLFGVQLIAGARALPGFIAQVLVGLLAGYVFAKATPSPRTGP